MNYQVSIDGRSYSVEAGKTVLQAARENGIDIPTLCDFPGLTSHGSCRMCIVEIEGRVNTPTACTTQVEDGMVIETNSPIVQSLRAELLKLLLSEHPSSCLFCPEQSHCDECMVTLRKSGVTTGCRSCPSDGQCQLQVLVDRFGITDVGYPVRYRMLPPERQDPFIDRDHNLCILCERCVRICEENHFASTLTLASRGTDAIVSTAFGRPLLEAGCDFCGACVEVCPTGTIAEKTRKWDGKPEYEVSTTCPLCSAGCQMNLLVKNDMIIGSLPDHASGTDSLCVKGRFGITELVNHPMRLHHPVLIGSDGHAPVSWEKAVDAAAEKVSACAPEKYGMVISANCSNETLYVAQKFARNVIGSNSVQVSSTAAYGKGLQNVKRLYDLSKPFSILSKADVILNLGFDGQYAQSAVKTELYRAKRHGARLITFHANDHSLSRYADVWLKPALGHEANLFSSLVAAFRGACGDAEIQHTVRLLSGSKRPAILVGSAFMTHADNVSLLNSLEELTAQLGADLILLPDSVNLGGVLRLGMTNSAGMTDFDDLDILHVIGDDIPSNLSKDPFILYQNLYPPAQNLRAGLILPVTAFTEEEGTFLDQAGTTRSTRRVVEAPGAALPGWKILCLIAQRLGVGGFDFENAEQVRAEFEASLGSIRESGNVTQDAIPFGNNIQHSYMGFPLQNWVAGLRMLYPEQA